MALHPYIQEKGESTTVSGMDTEKVCSLSPGIAVPGCSLSDASGTELGPTVPYPLSETLHKGNMQTSGNW
jgi:hypothetical protein